MTTIAGPSRATPSYAFEDDAAFPGPTTSLPPSQVQSADVVSAPSQPSEADPRGRVGRRGSDALVDVYRSSKPRVSAGVTQQGGGTGGALSTNSSAARTAGTTLAVGHADARITSSGDAAFAEVALLKGRQGSLQADILGVGVQLGAQTEVASTLSRVSLSNGSGDTVAVETVGGRVGAGVHNTDGSTGLNAGGSASLISGEVQTRFSDGSSFSINVGVGITYEGSYGRQDADQDGSIEHCGKIGYGAVTVGGCVEEATLRQGKEAVVDTAREVASSIQQWWDRL